MEYFKIIKIKGIPIILKEVENSEKETEK